MCHVGGENQRGSLNGNSGYSAKAQCTGNTPSYLEPIRDSLQIPIEGLLRKLKNVGGEVTIDEKTNQKHVENSSAKLPKPSMRQPIYTLNKGAIDKKSQQNSSTPAIPKKPQRQSPINWKQHFPKPQLRKISLFNDIDATATIKF